MLLCQQSNLRRALVRHGHRALFIWQCFKAAGTTSYLTGVICSSLIISPYNEIIREARNKDGGFLSGGAGGLCFTGKF